MAEDNALLKVAALKQHFRVNAGLFRHGTLKAVDGVSFEIAQGETLGLVGESGCGKTTVGRSILHLYKPTSGEVFFEGEAIRSKESVAALRKKAQMVFQDPYSSLDPRMTVADIIAEPMDIQKYSKSKKERDERVKELMSSVELSSEHATRYAHEFSGGQRQRIGIARALSMNPKFIVCDEPVSALDVSIQAQIINMFEDLQAKLSLTYLFIAHDISVVMHISTRIAVMYLGKIVEVAPPGELRAHPLHPYTASLLSAVPIADPAKERSRQRIVLEGDVPSPIDLPEGCPFRSRCAYSLKKCAEEAPSLSEVSARHSCSCWNRV
ncbi:MAG: ATP-binding cassette domain-containing protein [Eubacteriaceae bacterium]|jgi:oligopeptide transport system ATP-binding protein|nr:ATP-binding cassette domain-containing protein [Eubacteriaceae bacterium]